MNGTDSADTLEGIQQSPFRTIVRAWIVAGTLDIIVASIYYPLAYKIKLVALYQGIASGVLGSKAFAGGATTAMLGLALHYLIALIWTLFFFMIYPRLKVMSWNRIITAISYSIVVSCVMTFVVLPLSSANHSRGPLNVVHFAIDTIILMFTIGTPLSVIVGNFYSGRRDMQR